MFAFDFFFPSLNSVVVFVKTWFFLKKVLYTPVCILNAPFCVYYVHDLRNAVRHFVTAKISGKLYKIDISNTPQHKILCYFKEKLGL